MKRTNIIVIIIFALVLSSAACIFSSGTPETQDTGAPLSTAGLDGPGIDPAETGQDLEVSETAALEITEEQLTSLMKSEIEQRVGDQISDLQVSLRSGQIQITGDLATQGFSAPLEVVIEVEVDPIGRPNLTIVSSSVGPFPVPGDLVGEIEVLINQAFQEKINALAPNLHIDRIVIQNGIMAIYGNLSQ